MQETKKCTKCKQEYPLSNFYKNKLILDGHSNYCIDCTKLNSKKYFQRKKEKNNEQIMKMMLFSNSTNQLNAENTDNLMQILIIERLCKSILSEIDSIKKKYVKTDDITQF